MPRRISWIFRSRQSRDKGAQLPDFAALMHRITDALTAAPEKPPAAGRFVMHPGEILAGVLRDVSPGFLAVACLHEKRWETATIRDSVAAPLTHPEIPQLELPLRLFAAAEGPERDLAATARHLPPDWFRWAERCGVERLRFFPEPFRERGVWFIAGDEYRRPEWGSFLDFTARLLVTVSDSSRAGTVPPCVERDEVLEQEFARWLLAPDPQLLCEMFGSRLTGEFGLDRSLLFFQSDVDDSPRTLYIRGVEPAVTEAIRAQASVIRPLAEQPEERLWPMPRPESPPGTTVEDDRTKAYFPYATVLRTGTGARLIGVLGARHQRRLPPHSEQRLKHWLQHVELALDHQQRIAQLEALSYTDALTGIYNRRFFKRRLVEELTRARRFGRSLSLVVFDVDNLKELNDTYGHQVGDRALREVAGLVTATARSIDIACRYGGDEFVIIMPDTSQADCFSFTTRLQNGILHHAFRPGRGDAQVQLSVSLGAAVFPQHAGEPERLFWCADMAMLRAKEIGRNRALIYEPGMDNSPRPSRR